MSIVLLVIYSMDENIPAARFVLPLSVGDGEGGGGMGRWLEPGGGRSLGATA
jgi:hypothetical protein